MNSNVYKSKGEKTVVFVDYESWFWGLYNKFADTPNLKKFIQNIKEHSSLDEIYFFGDFTKEQMQKELQKLRTITNNIIDCSQQDKKKDYTDFIMLDHIYRTILQRPEIEQYVLVTGDGHFQSVVAYLTTFLDKKVGIYAVQDSLSHQLKESASWVKIIKPETSLEEYFPKILETIQWAENNNLMPTFSKTVESCSKYFNLEKTKLSAALSKLIRDGYIEQVPKNLPSGDQIPVLITQWQLINNNIW